MALIKKNDFIPKCLKLLERELLRELPDETIESEMINEAYGIIYRKVKHVRGTTR